MFSKIPFLEFGQMGNGNRRQIAESIGAGELSVFTVRKKDRNLKKETKRVTESRVRKPKNQQKLK